MQHTKDQKELYRLISILMFSFFAVVVSAKSIGVPAAVDSVYNLSDSISGLSWRYRAMYYYRGFLELKKKNLSIMSAPNRRYYMHGHRKLVTEDMGDCEFTSPDVFVRNVLYTYGSETKNRVDHDYILEFFNLTPYGIYLLNSHIFSPLNKKNAEHYTYSVDSICGGNTHISFKPKSRSMQVVSGSFIFNTESRCISEITFSGDYDFVTFTETVSMGKEGKERYLPKKVMLDFKYWYYGNQFKGFAHYVPIYTSIQDNYTVPRHNNMTERYSVALGTDKTWIDSVRISVLRPVPLSGEEQATYCEAWNRKARKDTTSSSQPKETTIPLWMKQVGQVGEAFFHSYTLIRNENTLLRVKSPNIGYSGRNGVTYRQDMEFRKMLKRRKSITLKPSGSYFFGKKDLAGRLSTEFLLLPLHNGVLKLESGLQNFTTSREQLKLPETISGDTVPVPDDLEFHDYYLKLDVQREIANGLDLSVGMRVHDRKARGFAKEHQETLEMKKRNRDVAANITFSYTPHQKYYVDEFRKVRLTSTWPTFVVNFERGIKGLLGSTSNYEKWEVMVTQDLRLDALHRLIWKSGGGLFTSRFENRFVQYEYFNSGISAYNWDDDSSGVFQLLRRRYYNNSNHYLRGHLVLESPTILFGNVRTRMIRNERLYFNILGCEQLVPYVEIGYGISNAMFDLSVFSSYMKEENFQFGLKVSLSIFD